MPAAEASFRNLILNQRVDTTAQFIDMRAWSACGEGGIEPSGLKGRACYAGLDLGATRDMTALVLVFAGDNGEYVALPFCWLPGETLQEREAGRTLEVVGRQVRGRGIKRVILLGEAPARQEWGLRGVVVEGGRGNTRHTHLSGCKVVRRLLGYLVPVAVQTHLLGCAAREAIL